VIAGPQATVISSAPPKAHGVSLFLLPRDSAGLTAHAYRPDRRHAGCDLVLDAVKVTEGSASASSRAAAASSFAQQHGSVALWRRRRSA